MNKNKKKQFQELQYQDFYEHKDFQLKFIPNDGIMSLNSVWEIQPQYIEDNVIQSKQRVVIKNVLYNIYLTVSDEDYSLQTQFEFDNANDELFHFNLKNQDAPNPLLFNQVYQTISSNRKFVKILGVNHIQLEKVNHLLHFNIQSIYNIAKEFTNIYLELQKFGLE
jgi:hypothetical protein